MNRRLRDRQTPESRQKSPFPTADEIATRAHELFVAGGRQLARVQDYWTAAEHDLLDRAARRLITKP